MVSAQPARLGAPELPFDLQLVIEHLPIADLAAGGRKLRLHKKQDITALANAIRTFGFLAPVIIDRNNKIVSGNGRIEAARQLGMTHVPCIRASHLDAAKLKAFRIAENQLSQLAGWDTEALGLELKELSNLKLDFSLEVTGFSAAKIDSLILEGDRGGENADVSPDRPTSPVSRLGDLWLLGDHRLYCGDATDPGSFDVLLQGEQVRTVFTDPPYNVGMVRPRLSSTSVSA